MKLRVYIAALHAALFAILLAVSPAGSGSMTLLGAGAPAAGGGGGGCAQATTFLARNGNAHPTETTALICGLVTDGIITGTMSGSGSGASACGSILDVLYIFATDTKAHARLNLCSTSYTASDIGAVGVTLVADTGITADSGDYLDSTFNPSTAVSANFSLNSASFGIYSRTAGTSTQVLMGASNPYSYFQPQGTAGNAFYDINAANFPSFSNTNSQGAWALTRTGASTLAVYHNNSSTPVGTSSGTSSSLTPNSIIIGGLATPGQSNAATDQFSAAFIGAGLTATQAANLNTRINNYLTALGVNVY